MNSRLLLIGLALLASATACGGGGGGTTFALPTSAPTSTPFPTYPGGVGSSYAFGGSLTQTDSYTYPTPSPLPSSSITASVTQMVTVGASPIPGGAHPSAFDFHTVTTQNYPLATNVLTGDAWFGDQPVGTQTDVAEFASVVADNAAPSPNTLTVTYSTPLIFDILPEVNGTTWTNTGAYSATGTYSDGSTVARTVASDGSYVETTTDTLSHHYTFIVTTHADGSGSYTGTGIAAFGLQSINVSAPQNGQITASLLPAASTPNPNPAPIVLATPAAWFAAGTPLYKETDAVTTGVAYPAACAVATAFGSRGTHVAQVIDRIDPMIGTHDHETMDTYNSLLEGPVCVQLSDTITANYDYLLDTQSSYYNFADFSGNAVHTQTIAQTLTIESATLKSSSMQRSAQSLHGLSTTTILDARANIDLARQRARHAMMTSMIRRMAAHVSAPGGLH